MLRKFIFKDTQKQQEFVLPVTPPSFRIDHGVRVETINIHQVGDVHIGGFNTLASITLDCLFPANDYPFSNATTDQPYAYIEKIQKWIDGKTILRFVLSDTTVNLPVFMESIEYGEEDGTNDLTAVLRLREYRELSAAKAESTTTGSTSARNAEEPNSTQKAAAYTVQKGDTLYAIARKFYGDPNLCWKLASFNGIKNANLIQIGQTVKIPDKGVL